MRYLGNTNTKEVHDLDNKQGDCHIDDITEEHKKYFATIDEAKSDGFDPCANCLDGSTS